MKKGTKMSLDSREKMRKAKLGKAPWNKGLKGFRAGIKHTPEHSRKIGIAVSKANKGRKLSETWKLRIAMGMKGRHSNQDNPAWKGDRVKYMGLHNWIRRHYGVPMGKQNKAL